jgi:peroxiredoxin
VQAGDTIEVRWDDTAPSKTVSVHNTNAAHDPGFQAALTMYKTYGEEESGFEGLMFDRTQTDSVKFAKVDDLFKRERATLLAQHLDSFAFQKLSADKYYQCTMFLLFGMLLPQYGLKDPDRVYTMQSEKDFHTSEAYRDFLFNYLRVGRKLLNGYKLEGTPAERKTKAISYSPPFEDYYSGLQNVQVYEMRDWFLTRSIIMDFQEYSFTDAEAVYKDFMTKIKVDDYADTLRAFYASIQHIKPGATAPAFTLTDDKGRSVSISDFRGKVVMIDFWGVGCGPCMYNIEHDLPAIHARYKDKNVVFLNVCVDSNTDEWQKCLGRVKVDGVNLLATGWTKNPVCLAYGIDAIPHYYLIDADGKIAVNSGSNVHLEDNIDAALNKIVQK